MSERERKIERKKLELIEDTSDFSKTEVMPTLALQTRVQSPASKSED